MFGQIVVGVNDKGGHDAIALAKSTRSPRNTRSM